MNEPNDGGAAFPIQCTDLPGSYAAQPGMTLRDWFAGQALAGILSNPNTDLHKDKYAIPIAACEAYRAADCMIAVRNGEAA